MNKQADFIYPEWNAERLDVPHKVPKKSIDTVRDLIGKLNRLTSMYKAMESDVFGLELTREDLGVRKPKKKKRNNGN